MFLDVPWDIPILGKIARRIFCIIKSNYVVSCNSFSINREKLGDFLKWTDYTVSMVTSSTGSACAVSGDDKYDTLLERFRFVYVYVYDKRVTQLMG